jgi:hypothetical protein
VQRDRIRGNLARYLCCGYLRTINHFATNPSCDCRPQPLLKPGTMLKDLRQANSTANSLDPVKVDNVAFNTKKAGI